MDAPRIAAEIRRQTAACGPTASISPSDVARALAPQQAPEDWRPLLGPVRQAALSLVAAGEIEILRKGKPVPAEAVRGVIRLRQRLPGPGVAAGMPDGPVPSPAAAGSDDANGDAAHA